jgi:hypothetical protein
MTSYSTRKKCLLVFILYFFFIAAFPFSHCQAEDGFVLSHSGQPDCNVKHLLFPKTDAQCCSMHGKESSSGDDHHFHFWISDANAPIRPNTGLSDQVPLAAVTHIEKLSVQQIQPSYSLPVQVHNDTPQEGFSSSFSGLSPPFV